MSIYDQCVLIFWLCGGLGSVIIGLIAEAIKMAPRGRGKKKDYTHKVLYRKKERNARDYTRRNSVN